MYHNLNPSVCRKWSDGNVFWWHDRECLLQETFKHFFLFLVAGNPEEPLTCRLCAAPAASPHTGMRSVVRRATLGYPQPRACLQSVPSHLPSLCVQLRLSPIGRLITGANADFVGCCFSAVRGSGISPTQLLQLCQMNAAHSHGSASQWAQISLLRCSVLFLPKKSYLLLPSASSDLLFIGRKALFFFFFQYLSWTDIIFLCF